MTLLTEYCTVWVNLPTSCGRVLTCSFVVLPLDTSTIWNPVKPNTGTVDSAIIQTTMILQWVKGQNQLPLNLILQQKISEFLPPNIHINSSIPQWQMALLSLCHPWETRYINGTLYFHCSLGTLDDSKLKQGSTHTDLSHCFSLTTTVKFPME